MSVLTLCITEEYKAGGYSEWTVDSVAFC